MLSDTENMIIRDLRMLLPEQQEKVVNFVQTLTKKSTSYETIWDKIDRYTSRVPLELWETIPIDGADQHDHYLYGTHRK